MLSFLVNGNGILISKEKQDDGRISNDYGQDVIYDQGSQFQLCSGDNLCPESSNDCFKFEICAADYAQSRSKIRYKTAYK